MSHLYASLEDVLSGRPGYAKASESSLTFIDSPLPVPGKSDTLTLFVPGTDVSLHRVALPARSNAEALRAAAYAVEDELAQPADIVHAALGPRDTDGPLRDVHICDRQRMQDWVTALTTQGFGMARLVAETALLPNAPTSIAIDDRILFSVADRKFAIDASFPDSALQAYANLASAPLEIVGTNLAERLKAESIASISNQSPLMALAQLAEAAPTTIDLRQGSFSARQNIKIDLKDWTLPIGLVAAASIAWLMIAGIETWSLSRSAIYMNSEAERLYQSYFPNEPVPTRLAPAINDKIGNGPDSNISFLQVSAMLYDAIENIEGANITSMRYDDAIGRISVGMAYNNYGDDVRMKTALETRQLNVTLGSSRSSGRGVSGELTVEVRP